MEASKKHRREMGAFLGAVILRKKINGFVMWGPELTTREVLPKWASCSQWQDRCHGCEWVPAS